MGRERLLQPIREFASRPFDKAASKVAYYTSWIIPIAFTGSHLLTTLPETLLELRPPEHFLLAMGEISFIWFMAEKIREGVIKEATAHKFKITETQSETIDRGPKPPSAGGGAY